MNNDNQNWRKLLAQPNKTVFPGYVHILGEGQNTVIDYVNDSPFKETGTALLLDKDGVQVPNSGFKEFSLSPGEFLRIDAREWLKGVSVHKFIGTVMMVQKFAEDNDKTRNYKIPRAPMVHWYSDKFYTQVGVGAFPAFNLKAKRANQGYFMFCPSVVVNKDLKTINVAFNYGTEEDYNDTAELIPQLHDKTGNVMVGKPMKVPAFGTMFIDAEEHFGSEAFKDNERYSISISHVGHVLSSLFFQLKRGSLEIVTGRHTHPPAMVFQPLGVNIPAYVIRRYVPFSDGLVNLVKKILKKDAPIVVDRSMD